MSANNCSPTQFKFRPTSVAFKRKINRYIFKNEFLDSSSPAISNKLAISAKYDCGVSGAGKTKPEKRQLR